MKRLCLIFLLLIATAGFCQDSPITGSQIIAGANATTGNPQRIVLDNNNLLQVRALGTPGTLVSGVTAAMTGVTSTAIIAGTAGSYTYITNCLIMNSHATVGTLVTLEEETSGTDLYIGYADFLGGGYTLIFTVPLKVPTIAKGINALNGTTGSNTYASCSGFKSTVSY